MNERVAAGARLAVYHNNNTFYAACTQTFALQTSATLSVRLQCGQNTTHSFADILAHPVAANMQLVVCCRFVLSWGFFSRKHLIVSSAKHSKGQTQSTVCLVNSPTPMINWSRNKQAAMLLFSEVQKPGTKSGVTTKRLCATGRELWLLFNMYVSLMSFKQIQKANKLKS